MNMLDMIKHQPTILQITFRLHVPHQINTTCYPIEQHFKHNHLFPKHLSKETSILNIVIRTLQLEKYVIQRASSTSTMLKGCNEVSNVGRTKGLELVHHLVKFLTLKNFHRPFPIFIEQMNVLRRLYLDSKGL